MKSNKFHKGIVSKSTKIWLDDLYYNYGRQHTDFWVCRIIVDGDGSIHPTKWRSYLDIQADEKALRKVNQRTILNNELVLDCDGTLEKFLGIIESLKVNNFSFRAYATKGHRAKHIHIFSNALFGKSKIERERLRSAIIDYYHCDPQLKSDKHMIALEYCRHWKSGEVKELVDGDG